MTIERNCQREVWLMQSEDIDEKDENIGRQ